MKEKITNQSKSCSLLSRQGSIQIHSALLSSSNDRHLFDFPPFDEKHISIGFENAFTSLPNASNSLMDRMADANCSGAVTEGSRIVATSRSLLTGKFSALIRTW